MELGVTKSATKVGTLRQRKFREKNPGYRDRTIVGVDGEGMDVNGRHVYTLLRAGEKYIENLNGLTSMQCLEFLSELDPDCRYVAFAFNYDVTMILREIGEYKLTRLSKKELRKRKKGWGYMPVDWQDLYEFDWIPSKEFKVRKKGHKWVVINDVWGFFQGKFCTGDVKNPGALEKWDIGTSELRARIAAGKMMRGDFESVDPEVVRAYNRDEIVALEELMTKFVATCRDAGYMPRKLQGAGQLAEAILAKKGAVKTEQLKTDDLYEVKYRAVWEFALKCYYGGRFESGYIGNVKGVVNQYDINSAYIDAMVDPRFPCLLHGEWKRVAPGTPVESLGDIAMLQVIYSRVERTEEELEFYRLYYTFDEPFPDGEPEYPMYMGLPNRNHKGCISYPTCGQGWFWSFEIEASIHQWVRVLDGWEFVRRCDCRPMEFMRDVYEQRLALGKDGKGLIIKTGMNSVYGKKVQSIGSPKYSNPIEGSFITAHCREKVQMLLHSLPECREGRCGESVIFIATDAIATTAIADVEVSNRLGAFSLEVHEDGIFMVQPGLYFGSKGGRSMKTRGVAASRIWDKREEFEAAFGRLVAHGGFKLETGVACMLPDTQVHILDQRFVGIRMAVAQNNLEELGQWPEGYRSISFHWGTKRTFRRLVDNDLIKTNPFYGGVLPTTPYDRNIGGIEQLAELREYAEDQPDWARQIETVE